MAIDVYAIRGYIVNLLTENNTTTSSYDISSGLTERVKEIIGDYAKSPQLNINYPAIYVETKNKKEEHFVMGGGSNKRNITMQFDIVAVCQYGFGQFDGRLLSDKEMITLAQNIESLFRNKITLSNTVDMCLVTNTDYDVEQVGESTYNSAARISLEVKKFSS